MRDAVIDRELDLLGVDHKKLHFVGGRVIENADYHCVQAHGFTGTRSTRYEQMRHLRKVCADGVARNILAEDNIELALGVLELRGFDYLAHIDHRTQLVGHLDAYRRLVRNRRFDSYSRRGKAQCDIIRKVCYLIYSDARVRLKLISCDGRTAAYLSYLCVDIEAFERVEQLLRVRFELIGEVVVAVMDGLFEAGYRRLAISRLTLDNRLFLVLIRHVGHGIGLFDGRELLLFLLRLFGLGGLLAYIEHFKLVFRALGRQRRHAGGSAVHNGGGF